jgi:hypothetical protein
MLKFFYNGIKDNGGELQKCSYSESQLISYPAGTITIYAKHYARFSAGIKAAFTVENNTDGMTDYFENDKIRVVPTHPLYAEVLAAAKKDASRRAAKFDRYLERQAA